MKTLLIIGAGGHGQVVKEIALACGYEVQGIAFLDDKYPCAVGNTDKVLFFAPKFDGVIVAIGNNAIRQGITEKLEQCSDINIATLIHPTAYVSPTAFISAGVVIEPKAIVNTNTLIGKGCIVSVGAIVDHDVKVDSFAHINAGAICKAGSYIGIGRKLEAGEVVHGFS